MTPAILGLLLAFVGWLVWTCAPDLRIELAKLTTCAHCGATARCRRACCGVVYDSGDIDEMPCRKCAGGSR